MSISMLVAGINRLFLGLKTMNQVTMHKKIVALINGETVKFSRGRGTHYELLSRKQESQLFNTLHREFNVARMGIGKTPTGLLRIKATTLEGSVVIDSTIETY